MNTRPDTIPAIISAFGGPTAVARIIGVGPSTASEMKRRKSIPVRYWKTLIDEAPKLSIDLDEQILVEAHSRDAASERAA